MAAVGPQRWLLYPALAAPKWELNMHSHLLAQDELPPGFILSILSLPEGTCSHTFSLLLQF